MIDLILRFADLLLLFYFVKHIKLKKVRNPMNYTIVKASSILLFFLCRVVDYISLPFLLFSFSFLYFAPKKDQKKMRKIR